MTASQAPDSIALFFPAAARGFTRRHDQMWRETSASAALDMPSRLTSAFSRTAKPASVSAGNCA